VRLEAVLENLGFSPWLLKLAEFDACADSASSRWPRVVLRYAFAFVPVALALLIRQWLESRLGPMPPFIVFFPAILLVAVCAGGGPGVLAILLSVLTVAWYFSPQGSFSDKSSIEKIAIAIFAGSNMLLCGLMELLRRVRWVRAVSLTQQRELEKLERSELLLKSSLEALQFSEERLVELNQKLHALTEHLQTVQERERIAIARDIHDDIGQSITVLKYDLEWLSCRMPEAGADVCERLGAMRLSADQLTAKVQRIAADLRPPLLDNMGLIAAIEWHVSETCKRSGLECYTMLNEDIDPIGEQLATAVMRIVQEGLTNVVRHAGATEVSVSLCRQDDSLILEISDNGCGIVPHRPAAPPAYGVIGMQERARICRGELEIDGEPGCGTTLRLTVPLESGEDSL
jgi:signal transduction histidine kinase